MAFLKNCLIWFKMLLIKKNSLRLNLALYLQPSPLYILFMDLREQNWQVLAKICKEFS